MKVNKGKFLKMIAGGIVILSGLLATGCHDKDRVKVLSEKKMANLIADLKLAEAYANNHHVTGNPTENRKELMESVLASHNVTQEQLDTTLGWYGRNLDKYSELYDKVDKRIVEKRNKLAKDKDNEVIENEAGNLWSYGKNGVISPLGNSDGWIISIPDPGLSRGDRIEWKMHLQNSHTPLTGILGVEYDNGTSEAVTAFFTNRQNIDLSLQTDTGKNVRRIYGSLRFKTSERQPLFVDSISLRQLPYDSLEYTRYRSQKKYGYPVRVTLEDRKKKAQADSIRRDSIARVRQMRTDSLKQAREMQRVDPIGGKKLIDKKPQPAQALPTKPNNHSVPRPKPKDKNRSTQK